MVSDTISRLVSDTVETPLPAGLAPDDLPIGVGFDGPTGSDQRLLTIGRAFERARGPFPRPPHSNR